MDVVAPGLRNAADVFVVAGVFGRFVDNIECKDGNVSNIMIC